MDADGGHQPALSNRFLDLQITSAEKKPPWMSMITAPSNILPVDETSALNLKIDLDVREYSLLVSKAK